MIRRLVQAWRVHRAIGVCCSWRWHADQVVCRERALDRWVGRANAQHAQDVADAFWEQLNRELRERGE